MEEYKYLLVRQSKYSISLYNGDWDDVVPWHDTLNNLEALDLVPVYT